MLLITVDGRSLAAAFFGLLTETYKYLLAAQSEDNKAILPIG
jgi:hypothetical protein